MGRRWKVACSARGCAGKVQLIPDRKKYAGGEVAEILVQSPFAPAEGVVTIRRSGLLRTERFTMSGSSHTLRLPLLEAMTPNVYVQVDLVGAAARVDNQGNSLSNLPQTSRLCVRSNQVGYSRRRRAG